MSRRSQPTFIGAVLLGALLVAACSSSADSDVSFEYTFDLPTELGAWVATGAAVDEGLVCPQATTVSGEFEDENGEIRTFEELNALNQGTEPFISVDAEQMRCDDGSGEFTLRLINEVDPTVTDNHGVIDVTWTITGGTGYEDLEGDGESDVMTFSGDTMAVTASGSLSS